MLCNKYLHHQQPRCVCVCVGGGHCGHTSLKTAVLHPQRLKCEERRERKKERNREREREREKKKKKKKSERETDEKERVRELARNHSSGDLTRLGDAIANFSRICHVRLSASPPSRSNRRRLSILISLKSLVRSSIRESVSLSAAEDFGMAVGVW